ncbi:MAG TPA: WXG100 family type VII secretion target [Pseudonocardiaceae bacterium]|jgi:WXG100 family type VII secretion target|nr:WXG100 family type VII secretion target [Pseudonocardiaceae bacterium]
MPQLVVHFPSLEDLMAAIRRQIDEIETVLDDLDAQVRRLSELWVGAASEGFQRTVAEWTSATADLRSRLVFLHELVATAYTNHATVLGRSTAIWRR